MSTVEQFGPEKWREFRDIRLRALADAPSAFCMTLADAQANSEDHWRSRLQSDDPILVVRDDGRPVAMGAGWVVDDDRMAVWGMWTAPEARGHGHARAIMAWLLDFADRRGVTQVELQVTEGNDDARDLYESLGFESTGEWEPLREGSQEQIELLRRSS